MSKALQQAAVIGQPISHSLSPALHQAAYRYLGVGIDYQARDVSATQLPSFLESLRSQADAWVGLSVTMPHKEAATQLIDTRDPLVAQLGVLNTVLLTPEGLLGKNTDVVGILGALQYAGVLPDSVTTREGKEPRGLILGAGGTSRAALAAYQKLGIKTVHLQLRTPAKAEPLVELGEQLGMAVIPQELRPLKLGEYDVVMSTLPPHAADDLEVVAAEEVVAGEPITATNQRAALLDAAYDPWPSRLAQAWQGAGGSVISGKEMLLYQAVEQVAAFTGIDLEERTQPRRRRELINVMCQAIDLPTR